MIEYPDDYPTLSAVPPPLMHSDHVYDYSSSERHDSSRLLWPIIVAVIGACIAVIAVVIAATVVLTSQVRTSSEPATVTSIATPVAPSTVTSLSTVTSPLPVPVPTSPRATATAPALPPVITLPPIPASSCPQRLRSQANADYAVVSSAWTGLWVPQLSSKQPGLVADGITWDCNSILAERLGLRGLYGAMLLWSGDWPRTYGHDDHWVTIAGYTSPDTEGASQWCQIHSRDSDHCYPTQIR